MGAANQQVQWNSTLSIQFTTWKSRAVEATGLSASLGVTMGSAAATAAGAAIAGFQGFLQGASRAASAQVSIPDESLAPAALPPLPLPPPEIAPPLQRPSSTGDLSSTIGKLSSPCPICVLGRTTGKHTYMENVPNFPLRSMLPDEHSQR